MTQVSGEMIVVGYYEIFDCKSSHLLLHLHVQGLLCYL